MISQPVHERDSQAVPPVRSGEAGHTPRVTASASDLEKSERWCTCCHRPLRSTFAWLELDQRTNTYHDRGGVPANRSQGWFPFGMTCARGAIAKATMTAQADARPPLSREPS